VDCPSYQDYNQLETNLLSYFFLQKIFEGLDATRFVLTVSMTGVSQSKMTECNTVFRRFLEMFVFD
jgi:hypothetical protein